MRVDLKTKTTAQILQWFESNNIKANEILEIELLESDIQTIGYKSFIDLAQIYFMKMLTPKMIDEHITLLRFQKLNIDLSFHKNSDQSSEKYGINSEFFEIDKRSQFSFLYHYQKALKFIDIQNKKRVLNIGINKGDEFKVIKNMLLDEQFKTKEFIGIDYSSSAIEFAKKNLPYPNLSFLCHDINKLDQLNLNKSDLIISIGTLQSSSIDFKVVFMNLFQNYLQKDGAMILGFPNCRWIDKEMIYGAKAPNYNFSEMSLVVKDIYFCKKYLQQKKYRVTITGKDYIFLTARKISKQ